MHDLEVGKRPTPSILSSLVSSEHITISDVPTYSKPTSPPGPLGAGPSLAGLPHFLCLCLPHTQVLPQTLSFPTPAPAREVLTVRHPWDDHLLPLQLTCLHSLPSATSHESFPPRVSITKSPPASLQALRSGAAPPLCSQVKQKVLRAQELCQLVSCWTLGHGDPGALGITQ